jgi:hypothetical protein
MTHDDGGPYMGREWLDSVLPPSEKPSSATTVVDGPDMVVTGRDARLLRSDPRSFDSAAADFSFRPATLVDLWRIEPTGFGRVMQFACLNVPLPYKSADTCYASVLFHVQVEIGAALVELGLPKNLAVEVYGLAMWDRRRVFNDGQARTAMRQYAKRIADGTLPFEPTTPGDHGRWAAARVILTG